MGVRVTINHLRAAEMCARSARPWFARKGLSWSRFVSDGYDSDELLAVAGDDALCLKVIAIAQAEAPGG